VEGGKVKKDSPLRGPAAGRAAIQKSVDNQNKIKAARDEYKRRMAHSRYLARKEYHTLRMQKWNRELAEGKRVKHPEFTERTLKAWVTRRKNAAKGEPVPIPDKPSQYPYPASPPP
jgi:hypothetical protein